MSKSMHPGASVNEHIRLVRPLGEGGMGTVWVADHLNLGTQVAVKFIHGRYGSDNAEVTARFHVDASSSRHSRQERLLMIEPEFWPDITQLSVNVGVAVGLLERADTVLGVVADAKT